MNKLSLNEFKQIWEALSDEGREAVLDCVELRQKCKNNPDRFWQDHAGSLRTHNDLLTHADEMIGSILTYGKTLMELNQMRDVKPHPAYARGQWLSA